MLSQKLYSANDFFDIVDYLIREGGIMHESSESQDQIKPANPIDEAVLRAKPEVRKMDVYMNVLKGGAVG